MNAGKLLARQFRTDRGPFCIIPVHKFGVRAQCSEIGDSKCSKSDSKLLTRLLNSNQPTASSSRMNAVCTRCLCNATAGIDFSQYLESS